ncbi:benzoate-CoA ligase family protein [Pseudoprimorskyibacter insulae]|uniref:Benzoate--CoA ligase n=1 Tax=Pseudoprimorskyibacter insulae TaxID=1695997 RepID=A0A2R8ATV8_9RHOB|nr:benzoate-CoA ligase family protein [Pseudoprimorskyibacter insulae]SPF79337.1 Benzoate--CoA ligase [Pseudoprimorskyibacter insulae]
MANLKKVEIVGGGPGGLYAGILLRRMFPDVQVRVTDVSPRGVTWGFGVVFSDRALDFLKADDAETHDLIAPRMERWEDMTLNHPDGAVALDGVGFAAIGRLELLTILQARAEAEGVELVFDTFIDDIDALEADLIIGADGLNSVVRNASPDAFGVTVSNMTNRFAWFGTKRSFDTLTQSFVRHPKGALNAHHYRYAPDMSTFIVEIEEDAFFAHGFDKMDEEQSAAYCEELFAEVLEGAPLVLNKSVWRQFPRLWCENWTYKNRALIGDAVHTAHFSIGSGTRLAMEDAIALVTSVKEAETVDAGLAAYQASRVSVAKKIVSAANTSCEWYETFSERMEARPLDFGMSYITRSGRIPRDRLRQIAPKFMEAYEALRPEITDPVSNDVPAAKAIGFDKAQHPNCSSILWDNLDRNPNARALTGPAGDVTYAELIDQAGRWGNAFKAAGLVQGDRIAFFLEDTPVYPAAFFGAVRAGFVPVLLNTMTPPDILNYYLEDSAAPFALTEAGLVERFSEAKSRVPLVVVNGEAPAGTQSADDFLAGYGPDLPVATTGPDDMAFWMYSSGTTGRPKGIVHLHHDMAYSQQSFAQSVLKLTAGDVCFSVPKIYFAYGFGNAFTFPFSVGACTLLMPGRPTPEAVVDTVEAYKPSVFYGLPTLYTAICNMPGVETRDLSSLRQCMSAAEILSEDVFKRWQALTGLPPIEGLGSTEMLHVYLSNTAEEQRLGSAGKAVPGYEIELRDGDGNRVGSGVDGVMYVRGGSSAPIYWNRPDKTAETMREDWIYTGDRFIEQDGFYYFQGRADDLIKVSGQWVWPLEVERCLNEHPDVHECAVLAHELEDRRMTLRAVVSLRAGAGDDGQTKALQDYVKGKLQPFKYPRIMEYVESLPKTGTGKIDRQALKR